ncbi:MAG TPA: amidohydrolase family protein, partial [Acidothermaceae bacterium]
VALCEPVRDAGGYYCPHHRNYGRSVVQGYQDCLSIAKCADVALHLAHCHVNYLQNAGRAIEVLDAIDAAVAQDGLDVSLDSYPYLAGATYLAALLPSWVHAGGADAVVSRLQDPETRRRILYEIEVSGSDGSHNMPVDWTTISVSGVADERSAWAVGATIAELASARDEEPGALFCNLLVADRLGVGCLVHVGNEDNVRAIMRHRAHTAGSDGILVGARPHPRGWGTFPRYLGTYVRELGILRLEECVAHLTSRPARRLRMVDRGVLRVGAVADIVVFDADTIDATGTYDDPRRQPQGIQHVMVNGEYTLRDGHRTDRLPGRAIRRA